MANSAKTVSINFIDVEVKSLSGEVVKVKDIEKVASHYLWRTSPTIPLFKASQVLHEGQFVDFTKDDLTLLIKVFNPEIEWALPFLRFAVAEYLEGRMGLFGKVSK